MKDDYRHYHAATTGAAEAFLGIGNPTLDKKFEATRDGDILLKDPLDLEQNWAHLEEADPVE